MRFKRFNMNLVIVFLSNGFFALHTATTTTNPCSNIHICLKRQAKLAFVFEVKKKSKGCWERLFKLWIEKLRWASKLSFDTILWPHVQSSLFSSSLSFFINGRNSLSYLCAQFELNQLIDMMGGKIKGEISI